MMWLGRPRRRLMVPCSAITIISLIFQLVNGFSNNASRRINLSHHVINLNRKRRSTSSHHLIANSVITNLSDDLDSLYDNISAIRCPFFRRRAADTIDNCSMLLQFLIIRHKSLPWFSDLLINSDQESGNDQQMTLFTAPGCKPIGRNVKQEKVKNLSLDAIQTLINLDWTKGISKDKGYYISGKLTHEIYHDSCLFTGPDPDMPVRGLRKYLSA